MNYRCDGVGSCGIDCCGGADAGNDDDDDNDDRGDVADVDDDDEDDNFLFSIP